MPFDGRAIQAVRPSLTVPQGLVGHWPLDLGSLNWSSNFAYDRSGRGNTGALTNITSAALIAGKVRQCLNLNGTSQYIDCGTGSSLNVGIGNPVTLMAWIYPTATNHIGGIISSHDGGSNFQYELRAYVSSTKYDVFGFSGVYSGIQVDAPPVNAWTHIVGLYSATTGWGMYYNGVPQTGTFPASNNGPRRASGHLYVGSETGATRFFQGYIDDARVYRRALSAQEIVQIYEAGRRGRA